MEDAWVNDAIMIATVETYSSEVGFCFADADDQQALTELIEICCSILQTFDQNKDISIENAVFWDQLHRLSAALAAKLPSVPDGSIMWQILCRELHHDHGYDDAVKFVQGAAAHLSMLKRNAF